MLVFVYIFGVIWIVVLLPHHLIFERLYNSVALMVGRGGRSIFNFVLRSIWA